MNANEGIKDALNSPAKLASESRKKDVMCFNVGDVIATLCAKQYRAQDKLPQDPFFEPLRTMLSLLSEEILAGRNFKLGRLIISLSLCIDSKGGTSQLTRRIVEADKLKKSSEGNPLSIQDQFSEESGSVTWSLNQILDKVQAL